MIGFDERLQCHVHGTQYDKVTDVGVLHIGPGECADMDACIRRFRCDAPRVQQIDVVAGGVLDTRYLFVEGAWLSKVYPGPSRPVRARLSSASRR